MKPKNLKEFKELIKRYESITLEEIKAIDCIDIAASELTGFSKRNECLLCKAVNNTCLLCVYGSFVACVFDNNEETFDRIYDADTPTKLRNAFRARAKHMKTLLP